MLLCCFVYFFLKKNTRYLLHPCNKLFWIQMHDFIVWNIILKQVMSWHFSFYSDFYFVNYYKPSFTSIYIHTHFPNGHYIITLQIHFYSMLICRIPVHSCNQHVLLLWGPALFGLTFYCMHMSLIGIVHIWLSILSD